MFQELKTESECRLVFVDIINGYTYNPNDNYFIKHYTELDFCKTEYIRHNSILEARKKGLASEQEKLKLIIQHGHWSKEEEADYNTTLDELEGLRHSLPRLVIPQQKQHMEGLIENKEKEFNKKNKIRSDLLGATEEQFASRRASEFHVLRSFYKDSKLITPAFTDTEIDELSNEDVNILIDIYNQTHEVFTEKNLKCIAVCPFFLNLYLLSDGNPQAFFGKPIIQLSIYQAALFSKGSYYKNIIEDPMARGVPEEYYKDLSKVIHFYDQQYSLILSKRNAESKK